MGSVAGNEEYAATAPRAPRVPRITRQRGNTSGCRSGRGKSLCPYCGLRPVDNAGMRCTECDDMLTGCDPGTK